VPGSPSSPACWTWRAGQLGYGSSSARNTPTRRPLRFTGIDGHRFTTFAAAPLADLELRHRRRSGVRAGSAKR
jgi:hypothetical protein